MGTLKHMVLRVHMIRYMMIGDDVDDDVAKLELCRRRDVGSQHAKMIMGCVQYSSSLEAVV